MKRVGLVAHPGRKEALEAARALVATLGRDSIGTRELEGAGLGASESATLEEFPHGLDVVVSLGGDGTFLRAARLAAECDCPIVGVKVGRMGFLTEIDPEGADALIRSVLDGGARVDDRLAVLAEADGDDGSFPPQWALNEIIVEKLPRERLVRLAVYVDGTYVTTFSADGVIVATPTGSTAYSFSARGPIVTPSVDSLILTPVAAHMVFDRSVVLDRDQTVVLEVVGEVDGVLSADGREPVSLPVGTRARIGAAPAPARLVRRENASTFLALVREKFDLPGDPRVGGSQ